MTPKWTSQQQRGIDTAGKSLLVSAAAGSGKTAVLAERCAHLVCKADGSCDVGQLLVVTFTEPAAAEMKTRIQDALRQRYEAHPTERLARQVSLAERASVSTIHGFCNRLLRQNFTLAGIDPEFEVLDGDEARLLRQEIATDLFHRHYDDDADGEFQQFIDAYGDGNDERLIPRIIQIHSLLASLIDPDDWINNSLNSLTEAAEKPLEESELGRSLLRQIDLSLTDLMRRCDATIQTVHAMGTVFEPYAKYLTDLSPFFAHWRQVLAENGLDMLLSETMDYRQNPPRVPTIRGDPDGKALAYKMVVSIKDAARNGDLCDLLVCTERQWQDGLRRIIPHARTLLRLVSEFTAEYSKAKQLLRALDFSDLERMALNILSEGASHQLRPTPLARSLHEQFRHVLVDEYQDINPIQDAILRLVSRECVSERSANLFCVGDVKQSIFRFRLAEPARFLQRQRRFGSTSDERGGELIHLRENFRSRAPLLEAINGVFQRLMTEAGAEIEYDESHRLMAGKIYPPQSGPDFFTGSPIEFHLLPKDPGDAAELPPLPDSQKLDRTDYEAILVARRIRQLMGLDGGQRMNVLKRNEAGIEEFRPIEAGDIVILLRTMQVKADRFSDILRAHEISAHNEAAGGLFDTTEVRDILSLLQSLDNQQQDIPLATVLRSPLGALPNADDAMARIRLAYPAAAEDISFHEAVRRYAAEQQDELAAYLKDFLNRLQRWRDWANKRPVADLLLHIYNETGYLAFCAGLDDGEQRVANLEQLRAVAASFGTFRRQGLYRFLRFLDGLKETGGLDRAAAAGETDNAVRIMSIHRSKGLEFPVVFLPDLGKEINVSDAHGAILVDRQMGLAMEVVDQERLIRYPSLVSVLVAQNLRRQTMAEELRLLYVAMTRAKEHLILVGTCDDTDRQAWKRQWTNYAGPLPPDVVQGAQRAIDWLGPVAMAAPNIFQLHEHPAEEVREWKNPRDNRPALSERQKRLSRLEPLDNAPPPSDDSQKLIGRFATVYPFDAFTQVPATSSVTATAKGESDLAGEGKSFQRKLDLPRFFMKEAIPKATDIGNATHAALQYFDFSARPSASEIERQIAGLVDRKFLAKDQAGLVNRDAILWFLQSELGQLIRNNHTQLIREVPFALMRPADDCPSDELPDQIMIRGRIDLLVPTPAGLAIVDYKTDNVNGPELDGRVETYSRQMALYSEAVSKVAGQKIASVFLVFLKPRRFVKL
jgi:ATP-dependent helicase/nuclease subunit A